VSLGCERHVVTVADRGGFPALGVLEPATLVRWNRERDDISNAVVQISNPGSECCELLSSLRSGRHEMVLYRGGQRVWEGPITRIGYHSTYVEIEARDVMHYVYRTIAHAAYKSSYPTVETVTERARRMLLAEVARKEAQSPPINVLPYLDIRTNADTAKTTRSTKPYQMTVWEDIDTMAARSGLDYTVVGRRIVMNDVHDVIGRTSIMTEADFLSELVVTEYGMELATTVAVTDGEGVWGSVSTPDVYYGEWELLSTNYEEETGNDNTSTPEPPTTAELRSQAQRGAAGRWPAPLVVRVPDGSQINPMSTALSLNDIVPGVRIPVRATRTCRTVQQEQKLDSVRVEETPSGEAVTVSLSPAPGTLPQSWDEDGSGPT
jgi:hypothetical protein